MTPLQVPNFPKATLRITTSNELGRVSLTSPRLGTFAFKNHILSGAMEEWQLKGCRKCVRGMT